MEILNKITMKSCGAQPKPRSVTKPTELLHIFGVARSFRTGSSNYGHFEKFIGEFEAVNVETGETFAARAMLLPAIAEALVKEALAAAGAKAGKVGQNRQADEEGEPATTPVEFAVAIGVKPSNSKRDNGDSGQGYEYTVRPLVQSKQADTLSHLREASEKARKALTGPSKEHSKK